MTLVDSSVWVDHLRVGDEGLAALLNGSRVLGHPFVLGELALGNLHQRALIHESLQNLAQAVVAGDDEVVQFITAKQLFGRGIGYVDAHLLAAVRLTPGSRLWTRDKRLRVLAEGLGLAAEMD